MLNVAISSQSSPLDWLEMADRYGPRVLDTAIDFLNRDSGKRQGASRRSSGPEAQVMSG